MDVVGFTVYADLNAYYDTGELVVFNGVTSNIGGHFQPATSSFLCPITGVYYFSLAVSNVNDDNGIHAHLMIEDQILASVRGTALGTYNQGTNSAITTCERGQSVWVQVACCDDQRVFGSATYKYSSLSGFLVHAAL